MTRHSDLALDALMAESERILAAHQQAKEQLCAAYGWTTSDEPTPRPCSGEKDRPSHAQPTPQRR